MRRSLAKFSESEVSNHTPSLADFTTTTPELKFSVHTGKYQSKRQALWFVPTRSKDSSYAGAIVELETDD